MLVWLNGAFGAGKTRTAYELQRRLDGAHVADPELLGIALHKMLPPHARHDFQDLPEWRDGVVAALRRAESVHPGPVIVPMAVVCDQYFEQIIGGLRSDGVDLRHFTLIASPETLRRRLKQRAGSLCGRLLGRSETWALGQIDRCVTGLAGERYATHLTTEGRTVDEVVEAVACSAGLELKRPRLSPGRARLRHLADGIREIRL